MDARQPCSIYRHRKRLFRIRRPDRGRAESKHHHGCGAEFLVARHDSLPQSRRRRKLEPHLELGSMALDYSQLHTQLCISGAMAHFWYAAFTLHTAGPQCFVMPAAYTEARLDGRIA